MVKTLLFDNSALNYIAGQSDVTDAMRRELGARIQASVKSGSVRVIVNQPALGEIAGLYLSKKSERYFPLTHFLFVDCNARLIVPPIENDGAPWRHALEVEAFRANSVLTVDDVLFPNPSWAGLRSAFMNAKKSTLKEFADETRRVKDIFAEGQRVDRQDAEKQLTEAGVRWNDEFEGWDVDPRTVVDAWTDFEMKSTPEFFGLSTQESIWPEPRKMRTLWFGRGYAVARLHDIFGDNAKCDERNDLHDGLYFQDASYADVFITQDDGLALRGLSLRIPELKILRTSEWLKEFMGW